MILHSFPERCPSQLNSCSLCLQVSDPCIISLRVCDLAVARRSLPFSSGAVRCCSRRWSYDCDTPGWSSCDRDTTSKRSDLQQYLPITDSVATYQRSGWQIHDNAQRTGAHIMSHLILHSAVSNLSPAQWRHFQHLDQSHLDQNIQRQHLCVSPLDALICDSEHPFFVLVRSSTEDLHGKGAVILNGARVSVDTEKLAWADIGTPSNRTPVKLLCQLTTWLCFLSAYQMDPKSFASVVTSQRQK